MKTDLKLVFNDINDQRWSYNAIYAMTYNSIFKGFEDNTFRPRECVTRAQMASILNRLTEFLEDKNTYLVQSLRIPEIS